MSDNQKPAPTPEAADTAPADYLARCTNNGWEISSRAHVACLRCGDRKTMVGRDGLPTMTGLYFGREWPAHGLPAPSVPQGEGDQLDVGYFRRRLKSLAEIVDKVTPKELAEQLGRLMNMTGEGAGSAIASPVGGDDAGSRSALPDASRQELLAQTLLNIARDYDARWRGKEGRGPIPLAELHPGGQRYWREKAALIEAALGASPRPATKEPEHPLKDFFTGESHACVTGWNLIGSKADCKSCSPGAKGFPEPEQKEGDQPEGGKGAEG